MNRALDRKHGARIANQPVPSGMRQWLAGGERSTAPAGESSDSASSGPSRFAAAGRELATVTSLPPITDTDKFLCVGKNYRAHLEELKRTDLKLALNVDRENAERCRGREPAADRPEQFAVLIREDMAKWAMLMNELGIEPE